MAGSRKGTQTVLLPDRIAGEIMQRITSRDLAPGHRLPTETALAELYGVSRNVVREAIARLRSDGVVDTRQGRGAIVRDPARRETFRIDLAALGRDENLADLFELRTAVESHAAGLAAERRSPAHLREMETTNEELRRSETAMRRAAEADSRFHQVIGQATGNGYLGAIIDYLAFRVKDTVQATAQVRDPHDFIPESVVEHEAILGAIRDRDAGAARRAMTEHIASSGRRVRPEAGGSG